MSRKYAKLDEKLPGAKFFSKIDWQAKERREARILGKCIMCRREDAAPFRSRCLDCIQKNNTLVQQKRKAAKVATK